MNIKQSKRLSLLPPYLFAEIDRLKAKVRESGKDIISLGIGDPDRPTFPFIIDEGKKEMENPANHQYPSYTGMMSFREAVCRWYNSRFGVKADPATESVTLIGSKEGIAHIPLAFVDPGDYVLIPDPGYPVYSVSTIFAGGRPYTMPLKEENGFLPDLSSIPKRILNKSRLMFLNYPNNPTSALATREFFEEAVRIAGKYNIIICHDAAYTEIYYGDTPPISFLSVPGAKDVGIEFHSLSKTYNMTGWRVAFAVGNRDVIAGLGKIKTNVDSGAFQALQYAGIKALDSDQSEVAALRAVYCDRRNVLLKGLDSMGWKYFTPDATFYVWCRTPNGLPSKEVAMKVLNETGVVITPGVGFGEFGEGYVRFALTVESDIIRRVIEKLKSLSF